MGLRAGLDMIVRLNMFLPLTLQPGYSICSNGLPFRVIIIIIISFMQGIYTYIPETNYVPREYSVAAILLFLFMVLTCSVESIVLLH